MAASKSSWTREGHSLAGIRTCAIDSLWLLMSYVTNTKMKRLWLVVALCTVLLWLFMGRGIRQTGRYVIWRPAQMVRRETNSARHFVYGRDQELYMYSAIVNNQYLSNGAINIVVTTMDSSTDSLKCCVLVDNKNLFISPAQEYFFHHKIRIPVIGKIVEYFHPEMYYARQYLCSVPDVGHSASHVTLASSMCSPDIRDYLPIHYPPRVPGGLAVCAKIAYGGVRDPEKIIEWFELQRLLGVDKVVMYDMGNPDKLNRVFKYYQDIGFLEFQPYELPGVPANRTLLKLGGTQFSHDETLAVLECHQRMAGYSFILSHDVDEFLIPRRNIDLKEFLKEIMKTHQDGAGFYLDTEFFIYDWGPTNPEEDLMLTRYRKATKPHRECTKHVHIPSRTLAIDTHHMHPFPSYSTYDIGIEEAILHHYRRCPAHVWSTCTPETIVDDIMTRYRDLYPRVLKIRNAINIKPDWNVNKQD